MWPMILPNLIFALGEIAGLTKQLIPLFREKSAMVILANVTVRASQMYQASHQCAG